MTKIEKLEKRFRQSPIRKDLTFSEAKQLLEYYGYKLRNHNGGSHYTITGPVRKYPTTIADHGVLKRYNVKDVIAMIDEVKEKQND